MENRGPHRRLAESPHFFPVNRSNQTPRGPKELSSRPKRSGAEGPAVLPRPSSARYCWNVSIRCPDGNGPLSRVRPPDKVALPPGAKAPGTVGPPLATRLAGTSRLSLGLLRLISELAPGAGYSVRTGSCSKRSLASFAAQDLTHAELPAKRFSFNVLDTAQCVDITWSASRPASAPSTASLHAFDVKTDRPKPEHAERGWDESYGNNLLTSY